MRSRKKPAPVVAEAGRTQFAGSLPVDALRGVHQRGHMPRRFPAPASGQHRYQWTARIQSVFPEKLLAGERRAHQPGQRVADVGRPHAFASEELLFKGKDAQQALEGAAHLLRTPPLRQAQACGATR